MTSPPLDPELVKRVAAYAGLTVPDEDVALLTAAAANQAASSKHLQTLELGDAEPIVAFDPRW